MAMVPKGGYPADLTHDFNDGFTHLLHQLESVWKTEGDAGQAILGDSYKTMTGLKKPALALMKAEIQANSGRGNYGPDFRPLL
jgi:hypothetical protein